MQFLSDTSKMLCGKQLMTADNDFYRTLSSIDDSKQNYDKDELNSMPSKYCYKIKLCVFVVDITLRQTFFFS